MAAKLDKKMCAHCGRDKELSEFYKNPGYDETETDCWCKDCVNKCGSKESIQKYFWENKRAFSKDIWDAALERAEPLLLNNAVFQKASKDKKQKILEKIAAQQVPFVMSAHYQFQDTYDETAGRDMTYGQAKLQGFFDEPEDPNEKVYSKEFHGFFTKDELSFLEDYMDNLSDSYEIDVGAAKDYAHKMAKASLVHDKLLNEFLAGECDIEAVNKAAANFDMLAKSANLAPSKRKQDDGKAMGSWSELTLMLETTGHPCTRKIQWELDDVDKTVMEYRHIITALGLDGE